MSSVLRLEGLSRSFGGVQAVQDVTLSLEEGARHVVLGPNGAGKTTLFRIVSGEVPPTRGRVFLRGEDATGLPPWERVRRGLARTYQVTNLFTELTVEENVMLAAQALDPAHRRFFTPRSTIGRLRDRVDRLLVTGGLAERRGITVAHLAYGEQRILEIVLALASDPKVLLLDEPTAGVPGGEAGAVMEHVRRLPADIAVVLIEHDLDVAFELSSTATALDRGQVIATGTVAEVRANPAVRELYLGADEP